MSRGRPESESPKSCKVRVTVRSLYALCWHSGHVTSCKEHTLLDFQKADRIHQTRRDVEKSPQIIYYEANGHMHVNHAYNHAVADIVMAGIQCLRSDFRMCVFGTPDEDK